uniref:CX domain-containing protein n=2 Tax=Wuchereria bancrofti TaxID=6293 RepID=A0AAF5RT22_WUCBA
MAQVHPSPWSRWDAPGYQYVSNKTKQPFPLQYDTGFENSELQFGNETRLRLIGANRLLDQKTDPNDANFVDCIYGIENSSVHVIERCLANAGCCETACCRNSSWQEKKYAWAIALLALFCVFVLLSLFVTLFCWLYNRAKDKRQKRFINQSLDGMSPAISQANLTTFENRNESGYYPYVGGPNQY